MRQNKARSKQDPNTDRQHLKLTRPAKYEDKN